MLAEETLFQEKGGSGQGLAAFLSYGVAEGDTNPVDYSFVAGLRYLGLLPGRGADEIGLGFVRAHAGAKFRAARAANGEPTARDENATELTYRAQITPWLTVQPVLQRIGNPGFSTSAGATWILGVRAEIAF